MTWLDISRIQELFSILHGRGGWTLIVLASLSVLTVATALVNLVRSAPLRPFSSGVGACRALRQKVETLAHSGADRETLEDEAGILARTYLTQVRSGLRLLELIITAAPLLGLLGTVLGMIDAFQAMQTAGNTVRPADLAGGIWEALITTAAGMIVALVALLLHSIIDAVAGSFKERLEQIATRAISNGTVRGSETITNHVGSFSEPQQSAA